MIYHLFPSRVHNKLRTFNIHRRMTFADAVHYANRFLPNTLVAISTADTSVGIVVLRSFALLIGTKHQVYGRNWEHLTLGWMRNRFLGLTRHEKAGCAMT
jgi:hypothetical protein